MDKIKYKTCNLSQIGNIYMVWKSFLDIFKRGLH